MNKESSAGRKYTLRVQFTLLFILLILGAIALCWVFMNLFLERYYIWDRHQRLKNDYELLQEAASKGELQSEEFAERMREIASGDEIGIVVMDSNASAVSAFVSDDDTMMRRMWDNILGDKSTDRRFVLLSTVEETENFRVQIVRDRAYGNRYMEMWGMLGDGSLFLLRTAIENLRVSTRAATRFLGFSGLFTALAGALVAYLLAGYVSRPVRDLTAISARMKKLDFSAKYRGKANTEIADLGQNINELSDILEETIGELKGANRELQEDLARREQAEEMRQEFLTGVTHELKTPLALIQGYAEGLQEGVASDPESMQFYCEVIVDESRRMNEMVQKLLTLNQLEFGLSNVEMSRFDLITLIREYLDSMRKLTEQQGIKVLFTAAEPVYVWADEFLTREVFSNYFTNAMHHAEGEKIIDIRLEQSDNCVRTVVFNTGRPIPEESLPHIWEHFYKVDKARTRAYGGNGVGLSIVRAIMELLHRGYGVDNYENGVAFWFELERDRASEESLG